MLFGSRQQYSDLVIKKGKSRGQRRDEEGGKTRHQE